MILMLAVAALLLGVFAVSMLPSALGISYIHPSTLGVVLRRGPSVGQLIPAALLLAMLIAAPLLLWSLWEEWSASYAVADDGLTFRTVAGIALYIPWSAVRDLRTPDADDAIAELAVDPQINAQIRNPAVGWLHRQAFGGDRIPIYPGVEARDELIGQIVARAGLSKTTPEGLGRQCVPAEEASGT